MNSLTLHLDEIKMLLHDKEIHLFALNVTELDTTISNDVLQSQDYLFERLDHNREVRRVAIYRKDNYVSKLREDMPRSLLELICIEISGMPTDIEWECSEIDLPASLNKSLWLSGKYFWGIRANFPDNFPSLMSLSKMGIIVWGSGMLESYLL